MAAINYTPTAIDGVVELTAQCRSPARFISVKSTK